MPLSFPMPASAQFDFSGGRAVIIRTYPVKRANGKPVPGPDGMPQPVGFLRGEPSGVQTLPTFLIRDSAPGAWMLDAFRHYQKRDLMAALSIALAVVQNGYLEIFVDKPCTVDTFKVQFEHKPTEEVPSLKDAGLTGLMGVLADAVRAAELQRKIDRLRDRYNAGFSLTRKEDQEAIERLRLIRFGLALQYNPRVIHPAVDDLPPQIGKELFKAAVAKGKPVSATYALGPIQLELKGKAERDAKRPLPKGCSATKGALREPGGGSYGHPTATVGSYDPTPLRMADRGVEALQRQIYGELGSWW